ncbi:hypothetical protein [Rhabdothermincola sp.]|uniref:hypothetical protein n=1 Tax=Rhabdothermincola sp. TaxID=2820405 RepID=UPI002FE3A069
MVDVVSIWSRARRDRAYRELLLRDPGTALAGLDLSDDELAMLDIAVRALDPAPVPNVFAPPETATEPIGEPGDSAEAHPATPLHPERKDRP